MSEKFSSGSINPKQTNKLSKQLKSNYYKENWNLANDFVFFREYSYRFRTAWYLTLHFLYLSILLGFFREHAKCFFFLGNFEYFEYFDFNRIGIGSCIITGYVIVTVHVTVCFTLLYLKVIIFNNLILLRISDDIELHVELLVQVRLSVRTT